ncbi:hypothetical protein JYP52_22090 [Nitratireductor aquibiodomus]|uniref:hypothetical protein n=1 Tax=Nitratireductor aquibiodomus TaxID=204799 RepID=UPI0019D40DC4|nr:hypothetical protein [Nitratireductor aquibiodomus]MBN7763833.1 hypothetical protein [Nitratireductor aquibiodomus]
MNQLASQQNTSINQVGIASGNGSKIAPQTLGEVVRFAEVMCKADIALPKHLRGNAGACMAVALQALEWEMSPFAVASKSYSVNGQIAYEAQLIMAVINTRSGIEGRLKFRFEGEGPERVCIAHGKIDGEELEVRSPKFKDITPKNSPLWKSDPDQQHCYYTARAWGRRHTPEVILGVYDRDEADQFRGPDNAKDVTPPSLMSRLQAQKPSGDMQEAREGFDMANVTRETEGLSSGQEINHEHSSPAESPSGGNGSASAPPSPGAGAADSSPATADEAGSQDMGESESEPASVDPDWLKTFAKAIIGAIGEEQQVVLNQAEGMKRDDLPEDIRARARSITKHALSCCRNEIELSDCIDMIAGVAGVDEKELAA